MEYFFESKLKVTVTDMRYFARSKFKRSLVRKKNVGNLQVTFKLKYLLCQRRQDILF